MEGCKKPLKLIAQRQGQRKEDYTYKAFITTANKDSTELLSIVYPQRWTIEEFFNFEQHMGWKRASTLNMNIRYGKMSMALIGQAAMYQLRKNLPEPYKKWTAGHLAKTIFTRMDGDIRVNRDTIVVTIYDAPEELKLEENYTQLPRKLASKGINPEIPWLYNFKLDFEFK